MNESPPPRVSVVIPVYNRLALLPRAIRSVQAQTFRDFEIVVVDDASTEDVPAALEELGAACVRYLRLDPCGGVARARNRGVEVARGEWIAFLDSDDEWLPEKLEKQLAVADQDPSIAVLQCWCYREKGGVRQPSREGTLARGDGFEALVTRGRSMTPSAFMIKRSALLAVGGFDPTLLYGEDLDLLLRLADHSFQFAGVDERLVVYHLHDAGQMSDDAVARLRGLLTFDRRWRARVTERSGAEVYHRWRKRRARFVRRANKRYVNEFIEARDRLGALRYVWQVLPSAWPLRRQVKKALLFALVGRAS